jgi:hypothetical protein
MHKFSGRSNLHQAQNDNDLPVTDTSSAPIGGLPLVAGRYPRFPNREKAYTCFPVDISESTKILDCREPLSDEEHNHLAHNQKTSSGT